MYPRCTVEREGGGVMDRGVFLISRSLFIYPFYKENIVCCLCAQTKTGLFFFLALSPVGHILPFFETILFAFVKQIGSGGTHVGHAWASIAVFAHLSAFFAVVCVGGTVPSTNDAFSCKGTVIAIFTNFDQGFRTYEGVTDDALAVAIFTDTASDGARVFSAHDKVGVVSGHGSGVFSGKK